MKQHGQHFFNPRLVFFMVAIIVAGCDGGVESSSEHSQSSTVNMPVSSLSSAQSSEESSRSAEHSSEISSEQSSSARVEESFVYAINAGSQQPARLGGIDYQPDRFASGGTTLAVTDSIMGAADSTLFQSERYGEYTYNIPVSNANYTIVLHFAELYHTSSGERSFDVNVEGRQELLEIDLFSLAGHDGAYNHRVEGIVVEDGNLTIELISRIDNATLSGFAIYSSNGGAYEEPPEPQCTQAQRMQPAVVNYDQAITNQAQKNPPSGAFGYAIEHATQTLPNHTIFRPALDGNTKIPIVAWGNGACSNVGTEQADFLLEVASHGYLVIANGGPFGSGSNDQHETELVKAIDWAIAENSRQCSQFYQKLDVEKIATMGWSCGGGMAHYAAVDPRVDTAVALNSGIAIFGDRFDYYPRFHSPLAIFNGDQSDVAYNPGLQQFDEVDNVPIYHANYPIGHGDAYFQDNGGEFGIIAVGWLNWMLKDDLSSSGKGMFIGDNCRLCRGPWNAKHKGFD